MIMSDAQFRIFIDIGIYFLLFSHKQKLEICAKREVIQKKIETEVKNVNTLNQFLIFCKKLIIVYI